MPALLIKDISTKLHAKLKQHAKLHHRSMNKEALHILIETLEKPKLALTPPLPVKGKIPLTQVFLNKSIREGRE